MDDNAYTRQQYEALAANATCPKCGVAHAPVSVTERCSPAIRAELARQMRGMSRDEQVEHFARVFGH